MTREGEGGRGRRIGRRGSRLEWAAYGVTSLGVGGAGLAYSAGAFGLAAIAVVVFVIAVWVMLYLDLHER